MGRFQLRTCGKANCARVWNMHHDRIMHFQFPDALKAILRRCFQELPQDRYQDAGQMAQHLEQACQSACLRCEPMPIENRLVPSDECTLEKHGVETIEESSKANLISNTAISLKKRGAEYYDEAEEKYLMAISIDAT